MHGNVIVIDSVCVCCRYTMYCDMTMCFVLLQNGWTPLHGAAMNNEVDCLKCLLDKGANIDSKDDVR